MIGVIPAAGKGTRAYPYTRRIPKSMLEINGEPNIARNVRLMREQLDITRIVITLGAFGAAIRDYLGDGARHGVQIEYVENTEVDKGLSHSILLAQPFVDDHFCVVLADECYIDSNHAELLRTDYRSALATCGVMPVLDERELMKNYAVTVAGGRVERLVEKPRPPCDGLLGVGTFILSPEVFPHLAHALRGGGERRDPVSVLDQLCRQGHRIAPFVLRGRYVNINDRDDLNLANNLVRSRAFGAQRVAMVLVSTGDAETTRRTVDEFRAHEAIDSLVLVTAPGAGSPQLAPGCDWVEAPSPAYGDMMRAGLEAADGDILLTALADGAFSAADVAKFLEYLKDADLVVGTRTTRQLIQQGTNMRGIVRLAHVVLAKLLEIVWWEFEPRFTDIGCAYRGLWASTYRTIRPHLRSAGPGHAVEVPLETLLSRKRVIEIPVSFHPPKLAARERQQSWRTFVEVLLLIVSRRFAVRR